MILTARLEEIVRLVPTCERVVDLGTDHALVPIALLSRNIARCAVGIDKSSLPLDQAKVNRHNAQVVDRLQLVCADGLEVEKLHAQDVVVMAGMGGRTMQQVLETSDWKGTLVLQPNRDVSRLREWLSENGWYSDVENIILDNKQYFWTSRWCRGHKPTSEMELEFGVQTHVLSRVVFTAWFVKEYTRLKRLPLQAIERQKMPLYDEMANRLSNPKNLG